ncbi:MAG: ATP-binding protein [Dehalococcoidia bacterium]
MQSSPTDPGERGRRFTRAAVAFGLLCIRERELQVLLDEACRTVRDVLDTDASKALELRPNGALLVRAGEGWPPGVVGHLEIEPEESSMAAQAMLLRQPVVVRDLLTEERFAPASIFLRLGVRSGVNVVVEQSPRPFGVLEVDTFVPRDFDQDDIDFLQSIANLLSVAIARQQYEEERDHLVSIAAHELRNPLTVILGFAQRLVRDVARTGRDAEDGRAVRELLQNAQRMQRLIDMLLDLGRVERDVRPRRDRVSLVRLLRRLADEGRIAYPEITFTEQLPEEDGAVATDEDLAMLVLGNIVENAAKYSRVRPEVTVALDATEEGWQARIQDGCGGINAEELDRLFDRYFRGQSAGDFRGFGLGLFVAHRSAEALGWRIEVRNVRDGCEFVVAIPQPADA